MGESIVFVVIVLICAAVFIAIGIYALKKKTPMHFWSGTQVKTEEITDMKAYNKENGIMWIIYGSAYIVSAMLAFVFGSAVGVALAVLCCTVGLIILISVYGRIYRKYKV